MKETKNPYVGPSPFEQDDWPLFYGRDGEGSELFSLTCAHSVLLFYAQSGAGKTSLLNARVIPKLKKQQAKVFPVARVGVNLPKEVKEERVANVFVFNTLLSLQGEKDESFDRLYRMSLAQYLRLQGHNGQPKHFYPLHVVIFDQFEELFTSFPEHWKKREDFFANVSEALQQDPFLRVVFAMREEYIAALEPFAPMLPLRLQKRFRLERLRKDAARKAVEGPIENTGRSYGPRVADKLVKNLLQEQIKSSAGTRPTMGEFVEPVQLQIVCHSLWEGLPAKVRVIDERAIAEFGDVDIALGKYYDDCLAKVVKTYPDVDEGKLRLWFQESLITPVKTRATVYVDEGSTAGLSPRLVKMLEDQRLIRPELRGGAKWYELTHDRFIEPTIQSNKTWFSSLSASDSFIYELEQRANNWEQDGRPGDALLHEELIIRFRQTLEQSSTLRKITPSERLKEYVNASETALDKRKSKEFRKRVIAIAGFSVAAVVLISFSIISTLKATQATREKFAIQKERGRQARDYSDLKGKQYDALIFGLEAVGLSDPEDAPPEAVDGLRAALTAADRRVWLRESTTAEPQRLEMSPDGKLALTVNNNELCVWDALNGQKTFPCYPRPEAGEWKKIQFSPGSTWLYAFVTPLPLKTERETMSSKVDQGSGTPSVAALKERLVLIFDARNGKRMDKIEAMLRGAQALEISGDSQHILADFGDDGVRILDVATGNIITPSPARQKLWYQIALSQDGRLLVAAYDGTRVELLATDSDRVVGSFEAPIPKAGGLWDVISFSPNGRYGVLVRPSVNGESAGIVWDNATGNRLASFRSTVSAVEDAAFSPDNGRIVVSGRTGVEVFIANTGNKVSSHPLPKSEIVLHAGPKTLMIQNGQGTCTVSILNSLTGASQVSERTYTSKHKINMAATTPDANRVIVADEDKVIQIWTLAEPLAVDQLSVQELLAAGCEKVRDYKEEFKQVSKLCEARLSALVPDH